MINRRTLVTVAGAVALAPAAHAQRGPYWDSRASMPWAIQEIYAAAWGERIITAGVHSSSSIQMSVVEVQSPRSLR